MPIEVSGGIVISSSSTEPKPVPAQVSISQELRGANKSGRAWKAVRTEKGRECILRPNRKTLGSSWAKKQSVKLQYQETRELQEQILEKKKERALEAKANRVNKLKRKAENELKSSKIQVLSHPEKIKKMNKKQLKQVYKTKMGDDGVVRLVGAYQ